MPGQLIKFLNKTYKVWIVIIAAVIFFLGYNAYLVDYSLLNLKIVLSKTGDIKTIEDARKLAAALDYSILTEVSSPELQSSNISSLELAKDILSNLKDENQLKDVKFILSATIKKKEAKRPAILVALDNIGRIFTPAGAKFSKAKLEAQVKYLKEYIKTLEEKTKLQEAYYELANVYTKLLQFDKAKEAYRALIDLDPNTALARKSQFNLAWNEKFQGNFDEAIKEFDNLYQTSEDDGIKAFSEYQLADSLKKKGEYEKAAEMFQGISRKYPREEFAQLASFQAGYINLYDLSDYEKARQVFEEAKMLFQGTDIVRQIEKVTMDNIVEEYRKKGFNLLKEGQLLLSNELFEKANKNFDKGLEIRPEDGISFIGKALAYLWLKDSDKAQSFTESALEIAPKEETVVVNAGYIYSHLNLTAKAIKEYKRYLSLNRKSILAHFNLGYLLAAQGKLSEAVKEFKQSTKIDPKFVYAYNNLGVAYWQLHKYAYAIDALRKAVKIQPQFERAQFNMGMAYLAIGSYGEAQKALQKVSESSSEYGQAIYNLRQIEKKTQPKK